MQQRDVEVHELIHNCRELQQQQQQQQQQSQAHQPPITMSDVMGHEATELDRSWKDVKSKSSHRVYDLKVI